jgi:hypothetical protein
MTLEVTDDLVDEVTAGPLEGMSGLAVVGGAARRRRPATRDRHRRRATGTAAACGGRRPRCKRASSRQLPTPLRLEPRAPARRAFEPSEKARTGERRAMLSIRPGRATKDSRRRA